MTVICIRLGTMGGEDRPGTDARRYLSWLSRRDMATMVERCIEVDGLGYDTFYGASANTWKTTPPVPGASWDTSPRTTPRGSGRKRRQRALNWAGHDTPDHGGHARRYRRP